MKQKRILSMLLALVMVLGAIAPGIETARAETAQYEKIVEWEFDGADVYGADWTKGGYTTTAVAPTYTITDGRLQIVEDYTGATSATYNRVMAQYSFGASSQKDLSKAVRLTFNYYCKTGDAVPSQFIMVYTGKLEGASANTTKTENSSFSTVAVKQDQSDLEGYDLYAVTIDLKTDTAEQRGYITRWQLGEIRTNNTYQGTVYYDNIVFWKEAENLPTLTLDKELAVYNQPINAVAANISGELNYQWYLAASYSLDDADAIDGAVNAVYTPLLKQAGGWIYCQVTNGSDTYKSSPIRVAVSDALVETAVPFTTSAVNNDGQWFLTNTKAYSGKFDANKLAKGGYFFVTYNADATDVPVFQWATWSSTTGKTSQKVAATQTGTNTDGTKWAKYSYEDLIKAWGNEDFSELKALRLYYTADDKASFVAKSVSWFGPAMSYGELGETVAIKGSYSSYHYLFTRHVGGDFDSTRIKDDSFFYVEYQGDENALNMVLQSHSNKASTYVTIAAAEYGETGTGYYSIFSAADIEAAFGEDLRHLDGIRLTMAADKAITANASLYFFDGEGVLIDDIAADGFDDAVNVPWTKYDDTDKTGIAVIGASITQNPLVTAAALSGAPFYAPNGGWNAILDRTDVVTYGIGSQTTINVAERFDEVLRYNYDTIIIQCGNNDLGAFSDESKVIEQEVSSYTTMFEKVKAKNVEREAEGLAPIRVFVIAINPTNSESYSNTMQSRIENVVAALDELSANYDFVTYIDELHEAFKNKDENGNYITGSPSNPDCTEVHVNPALVMSDGLHPIGEGYALYNLYLKPLLASTDPSDTRLVSLSYRLSSEEKKTTVTGFETLEKSEAYEVLLPAGTALDATVQMYVTASNLSATVLVNGAAPTADSYSNDYVNVTLASGVATAEVVVTSPDNNTSYTYTVTFKVNQDPTVFESEDEFTIEVSDSTIGNWPYAQIPVSVSKVNPGSTLEFDLTVDNVEFTKMWLEGDFDWVAIGTKNLTNEDFESNTYHVVLKYVGTAPIGVGNVQIKTGGDTDFRGTLTISNLKIINDLTYVDDDPSDDPIPDGTLVETVLSDTEASAEGAWQIVQTVYTANGNGTFDSSAITEDGYFTVTYTGTEGAVYLALAEWTTGAWISVNVPASTTTDEDGNFVSTFSYDAVISALNTYNASNGTDVGVEDIDAITIGAANATGTTTVKQISWWGYPTEIDLGETEMLFDGSKTASTPGTNLTFFYTEHVGGTWDASQINEGSYIYVEYTGAKDGIYLAFTSASGATQWVAVYPDETGVNDGGRYYSIFKYENFAQAFGTNFARLDQIQAYCWNKGEVTLKRIAYFAGEGDPVDTSDGTWDRPDTGIAFIGDSIVQNPLVDTSHLNGIDWNGILDRDDCVNYGIGGQTTNELVKRIDELAKKNYEKVVMLCGINDIGRGLTNEQIVANYESMFATLKASNADVEILLISVLPTTPAFYTNAQDRIASLNVALKALADETENVEFVDCYSEFYDAATGYCKDGLTFDGLHPNLDGYAVIAEILNPYLTSDDDTTDPDEPTDPEPTDPEPTDPEPTDPEPTDPEPTDPEPTDPEPTDPEPTDPEPTDPAPTDPEPTDPEPTDPEPTDPAPTDPEPTDPAPTDPKPTDPKPTDPEPTDPSDPAEPAPDGSTTEIYSGNTAVGSGWQQAVQIYATAWDGPLDGSVFAEDGHLSIHLTCTTADIWSAHVVLQGSDESWNQIDKDVSTFITNADGSYTVTFTYDELVKAYGSSDFADLGCFYVYVNSGAGSAVTVTSVQYTAASKDEDQEPNEPVEPEKPTEPSEPVEPEKPTEPSEPVEPEKPTEPSDPVEPEKPTEPSEPEKPTEPSEPVEPEKPTEPSEPVEPSEPEQDNPQTGNNARIYEMIGLMLMSLACMVLVLQELFRRRLIK